MRTQKNKNKIRNVALSISLAAVLGVSVAGCTTTGGSGYSEYYEDGRMILTIWAPDQYADATIKANFQAWLDEFNETDKVKELGVYLEFQSFTQLPTTLSTACISGPSKMPDIVIWDRFATPSNTTYLMPLDDLIAQDGLDTSVFLSEAYNELTVDGYQYGLPLDADPWGIYINMDIVEEYNAENPDDQIDVDSLDTWSELMDAADKLTERSGSTVTRSGLNTTSADGQFFSFVYTGTGELIDTDPTSDAYGDTVMEETPFNDGESLRVYDTLAFFNQLYDLNLCNTGHGGTDAFGNGYCAMTYGSIYFPQELSSYSLKNYKMIPYPARDLTYVNSSSGEKLDASATDSYGMQNGQVGGMLGGYGLAIPQPVYSSMRTEEWEEHVSLAWEVIKLWLYDDEVQESYYTMNEVITCRSDLWDNDYYTNNTGVIGDILPYLDGYKMRPSVAGYEVFESSIVRADIQKLKEGSLTVYATYTAIRSEGNSILRQAQGRS